MDKNQYERYKQIDRILRSTPDGLSLDMLLERLNTSLSYENQIRRRQLQYDLEALKDLYGAPIDNKKGARRIKYEDASYSIVTHEMKEALRSMSEQIDNGHRGPPSQEKPQRVAAASRLMFRLQPLRNQPHGSIHAAAVIAVSE